jgi:ubiquinone/menaquinone biosynthesis C-methylase UbiE
VTGTPSAREPDRPPGQQGADIDPGHYSYTVYADPAMADAFDRARFSGPIGEWLADAQADLLRDYAGPGGGGRVLDVGTGTGRAALVLADAGAEVIGIDASAEMLRVAQARADARRARVQFAVGDAHRLDFAPQSFDTVVSLRVLMHTPDWRRCVAEACRVARTRVIVDYPAALSAAALQAFARHMAHRFGARTEPYRVFTDHDIRAEFARHGFRVTREHRQFVLPIAMHKALGARAVSERVERMLAAIGLLGLAGSPVTVLAER